MMDNSRTCTASQKSAVFLDRDGTVLKERYFLTDPRRIRFYRNVPSTIALLRKAGYLVVVVSNQSGIARGLLTEKCLLEIHRAIQARLANRNAKIDGFYYCPHLPPEELEAETTGSATENKLRATGENSCHVDRRVGQPAPGPQPVPRFLVPCKCRKPAPGLLLRAAREMRIDLGGSFLVGDSLRDIQAGKSAGVKTILVLTGNGKKTAAWLRGRPTRMRPDHIAKDLPSAARRITAAANA